MKIGIIGAGQMGSALARLLVKAERVYEVTLSNSRDPSSLKSLVQEIGPRCIAKSAFEAVNWAEIIVLMMPWITLPSVQGDLQGKIVIDALNPFDIQGNLIDLKGEPSSALVQQRFSEAKMIKVFNTIWAKHLAHNAKASKPLEERDVLFMASDHPEALPIAESLIEDIGFTPFFVGSLKESRLLLEPTRPFYDIPMTLDRAQTLFQEAKNLPAYPVEVHSN